MKLVKHTDYIFEYQNIIDTKICDDILNKTFIAWNKNKDYFDEKLAETRNKIRYNECIHLTRVSGLHKDFLEIDSLIHQCFSKCHQNYINDNPLLRIYLGQYLSKLKSEYIFRHYKVSDYYDWHVDISEEQLHVISYILYLNDDFIGGETLFLKEKLKVSPKKGSMLCFPCDFSMLHKSTKITAGEKSIIWSCFSKP